MPIVAWFHARYFADLWHDTIVQVRIILKEQIVYGESMSAGAGQIQVFDCRS